MLAKSEQVSLFVMYKSISSYLAMCDTIMLLVLKLVNSDESYK